eukprot:scpid30252/ scgid19030/ Trans-1,2-dihydrobenzene-1,2-diol dehydrogenase; D-xylose 1-dehydrogenase; D-xylose-NADP dehydrogenase; Dimeric dihydrodiol dehydrogenase
MAERMEVPSESRGLRWGICGPGNTAYDFVTAIACLQKGTHVVTAVASRSSREKAEKMAQDREKFGDWIICSSLASLERGIYTQYEQLAADPQVDVVYAGVTHPYRHLVVMAAQASKKPCLVENPMTVTAEMADRLINTARREKIFLMEALWTAFMPAYDFVRDLLKEGKSGPIGQPKLVTCHTGYKERPCLPLHKLKDKGQSGGAMMDIGIYGLYVAFMAFDGDHPKQVAACGTLYDTGVDEMVNITLKYRGNRMAVSTVSTNTARPLSEATIHGTKGWVRLCHPFWCCTKVMIQREDGSQEEKEFPEDSGRYNFVNSSGLRYQADALRDCFLADNELESSVLPLEASSQFRRITDEVRRQLGVQFSEDAGHFKT